MDAIIVIHNFFIYGHSNAIVKNLGQFYYNISCKKVIFFIKLCKIYYKKIHSKSKELLVFIIYTKLFEHIQINLINMQSTFNITLTVIYK